MRPVHSSVLSKTIASGLVVLALGATTGSGEEPGRLGRLFRFGGAASPRADGSRPSVGPAQDVPPIVAPSDPGPRDLPAAPSSPNSPQPRLIPQPRVSRAVTDAEPLVTRVSLGRSDDGTQFGMFMQVYADGTVIDGEGVHKVGREAIKEVAGVVAKGDFSRIKGHCGGPSTDFIEQVQMVVYERNLGRLRANSFSFSGNTQGCDHAVHQLQTTLDALQARLSRPGRDPVSPPTGTGSVASPAPTAPMIRLNDRVDPVPE